MFSNDIGVRGILSIKDHIPLKDLMRLRKMITIQNGLIDYQGGIRREWDLHDEILRRKMENAKS